MRRWSFAKGHGTENDFVLLVDPDDERPLDAADVVFLCDRRAGIGADGVLRAVRAGRIPEWDRPTDLWFMDYRNADGSVAEMCGNGVRVFVRHLVDSGLASGPVVPVATRAGLREAELRPGGLVRVAMGPVRVHSAAVSVATTTGPELAAWPADVGNPHAVAFVDDLASVDLGRAPTVRPDGAFPAGVNVEYVRRIGDRHIAMRVFERGSGETRSCGTGTVAAAAVTESRFPGGQADPAYRVDVPGGTVTVELTADQAYLTGPAVVVAHGEVELPDR